MSTQRWAANGTYCAGQKQSPQKSYCSPKGVMGMSLCPYTAPLSPFHLLKSVMLQFDFFWKSDKHKLYTMTVTQVLHKQNAFSTMMIWGIFRKPAFFPRKKKKSGLFKFENINKAEKFQLIIWLTILKRGIKSKVSQWFGAMSPYPCPCSKTAQSPAWKNYQKINTLVWDIFFLESTDILKCFPVCHNRWITHCACLLC